MDRLHHLITGKIKIVAMLRIHKYLFLSCILFFISIKLILSQASVFQNIEDVSIVTDRKMYLSGESVMYSAFCKIKDDPNAILSEILYVELFDNNLNIVATQKKKLVNGVVNGAMKLTEQLETGYYILRAYTRYQENFPAWQFESLVISIINPNHPLPAFKLPNNNDQYSIASTADGKVVFGLYGPITSEVDSVKLIVNESNTGLKGVYYESGLGRFNYEVKKDDELKLLVHLKSSDTLFSPVYKPKVNSLSLNITNDNNILDIYLKDKLNDNGELKVSVSNFSEISTIIKDVKLVDGEIRMQISSSETESGLTMILVSNPAKDILFKGLFYIDFKSPTIKLGNKNSNPGEILRLPIPKLSNDLFPIVISVSIADIFDNSDLIKPYL